MKYLLELGNDKKLLLTAHQLEVLVTAVDGADMLTDKHVGDKKGTHGYNNCYIHDVQPRRVHEWLNVKPVADDYLDTIKLAVKLHDKED